MGPGKAFYIFLQHALPDDLHLQVAAASQDHEADKHGKYLHTLGQCLCPLACKQLCVAFHQLCKLHAAVGLEKRFAHEYSMLCIHVWMLLLRLRAEAKEGADMAQMMYEDFQEDVEMRVRASGVKVCHRVPAMHASYPLEVTLQLVIRAISLYSLSAQTDVVHTFGLCLNAL